MPGVDAARKAYAEAGVEADVSPFIDDMARAYADADLVICRAGALTDFRARGRGCRRRCWCRSRPPSTITRPATRSILVREGAAVLIADRDLTAERLAAELQDLCAGRGKLLAMAERARLRGEAARRRRARRRRASSRWRPHERPHAADQPDPPRRHRRRSEWAASPRCCSTSVMPVQDTGPEVESAVTTPARASRGPRAHRAQRGEHRWCGRRRGVERSGGGRPRVAGAPAGGAQAGGAAGRRCLPSSCASATPSQWPAATARPPPRASLPVSWPRAGPGSDVHHRRPPEERRQQRPAGRRPIPGRGGRRERRVLHAPAADDRGRHQRGQRSPGHVRRRFGRLKQTFVEFLHNLPFYGWRSSASTTRAWAGDPGRCSTGRRSTYGFSPEARMSGSRTGSGTDYARGSPSYAAGNDTPLAGRTQPSPPHNVLNALAAVAIACDLELSNTRLLPAGPGELRGRRPASAGG